MSTEQWRPIPGAGGYEASNEGRIRNRNRLVLKPRDNGHGYLTVKLLGRNRTIHSLVANAFHGAPAAGQEVRHMDGNKMNNRAGNLRWGTRAENIRDQVRHGTHRTAGHHPTHCNRGHEFTVANTYLYGGRQYCRRCRADTQYALKHEVTITEGIK